jgi:hypothetical protein
MAYGFPKNWFPDPNSSSMKFLDNLELQTLMGSYPVAVKPFGHNIYQDLYAPNARIKLELNNFVLTLHGTAIISYI